MCAPGDLKVNGDQGAGKALAPLVFPASQKELFVLVATHMTPTLFLEDHDGLPPGPRLLFEFAMTSCYGPFCRKIG